VSNKGTITTGSQGGNNQPTHKKEAQARGTNSVVTVHRVLAICTFNCRWTPTNPFARFRVRCTRRTIQHSTPLSAIVYHSTPETKQPATHKEPNTDQLDTSNHSQVSRISIWRFSVGVIALGAQHPNTGNYQRIAKTSSTRG
jgi:hypothetical protein